jgi:hypothetical protein
MERKHYMDEFENFLSEKADQYKLYPSDKVWENIHKHLHPNRRWPYITAGLLLIGLTFVGERFISHSANTGVASAVNSPVSSETLGGGNSSLATESSSSVPKNIDQNRTPVSGKQGAKVISMQDYLAFRESSTAQKATNISPATGEAIADGNELVFVNNPVATVDKSSPRLNPETSRSFGTPAGGAVMLSVQREKHQGPMDATADAELARPWTDNVNIRFPHFKPNKWAWQFYVAPTVSYRNLSGSMETKNTPVQLSGIPYIANADYGKDVNAAVSQRPAMGLQVGTSWIYSVNKMLRLKIGLQLNYSRYMVNAYKAAPERAAYAPSDPNGFTGYNSDSIRLVSIYRNFNGYTSVDLTNEYFQLAAPMGAELKLLGDRKVEWVIAGTVQPTYNLNNQAYLISTNFKNYAEEPTLIRRWNLATSFETYVSISTGNYKWQIGPQFRYQLLSSYKDKYPIKEYLLDYGFKIGLSRTIR